MVTIKVDAAGFLADLEKAAKEGEEDAVKEAQESAGRISDGAIRRAPRDGGELAGSISATKTKEGGQVRVESGHGVFVEFGTVHMRAEPFIRPAIAEEAGG